ncbi:MAG: biopolymer transporter ExbD [Candidatus Krumholzibacteria bacterium]|nr:biopolymer transporter ExbD [Candidatus Krumholzibacteria bacterium]MDH4337241.1 biopolymer transporter ExbD [Candidatus Krumholzibacteria bacterium]MDH5268703.1 biopolymer transporter ExbD [Candidatus Krumholzibacteria bacterium]
MRTSTRRGYRKIIEGDLELMPLMNLFVAMIPMLLISAVFLNVTVIDMKAPSDEVSEKPPRESLGLSVTIQESAFVIEGRGLQKRVIARADADADQQLGGALAQVAISHPDNKDVVIVSQPDTNYGDIVAVMDISRENGLPGVALMGAR